MMNEPYETERYRYTAVRLIKERPECCGFPELRIRADFECEIVEDERLHYETDGEFVIYLKHFILKDACLVDFEIELPAAETGCGIKYVLCEGKYIPFELREGHCHFQIEVSGLSGPTRTLYAHTLLREDGLTLRVEENDAGRCAGQYSKESYPATQIEAATHYSFAARELLRRMGIPQYLHAHKLGYLLLLGFETCNEIHADFPPHWHLIFRWPYFCGSQAPHIYLDEQGRMTENIMGIDGMKKVRRVYQAEEWCHFVDMYGGDVLAFRLLKDGGMELSARGGNRYRMAPYQPGQGVSAFCDERYMGSLTVENDTASGRLTVRWQDTACESASYTETIDYDPLTGVAQRVQLEHGGAQCR